MIELFLFVKNPDIPDAGVSGFYLDNKIKFNLFLLIS